MVNGDLGSRMDPRLRGEDGFQNIHHSPFSGREFLQTGYLETTDQIFADGHERSSIVKFSAICWCTEDRYELATSEKFVAIINNLVGSTNEIQIVE